MWTIYCCVIPLICLPPVLFLIWRKVNQVP